jgi:hypothetical protein
MATNLPATAPGVCNVIRYKLVWATRLGTETGLNLRLSNGSKSEMHPSSLALPPAGRVLAAGLLIFLSLAPFGRAQDSFARETTPGGRDRQLRLLRLDLAALSAEDEARDAREIADRLNEALGLRREVVITLLNDTAVNVSGRVTAQRYWVIITGHDGSEFRCRAAMIASVRIR